MAIPNSMTEDYTVLLNRQIERIYNLVFSAKQNPSGANQQRKLFSSCTAEIEELDRIHSVAVTARSTSSGTSEAGYIEALENMRKCARPLLFWFFVSQPFFFSFLSISDEKDTAVNLLWGVSVEGLTNKMLLKCLILILGFYWLRYLWQMFQLRLNFPDREEMLGFSFAGKYYIELETARKGIDLLVKVKDTLSDYNIHAAKQALQRDGDSSFTAELTVGGGLKSIRETIDETIGSFNRRQKAIKLADTLKYRLPFYLIFFVGLSMLPSFIRHMSS